MNSKKYFSLLAFPDLEVGKVGFGTWSDPEGDGPFRGVQLEVVDNEAGLRGPMDVKAGGAPVDDDFVAGPDAGFEIDVGFVLFGRFLAQAGEAVAGVGAVLGGVVAADLIVGTAVSGAQVDILISITAEAKGDAYESASATSRIGAGLTGEVEFNRSIEEFGVLDDGVGFTVGSIGRGKNLDCAAALVGDIRDGDRMGIELGGGLGGGGDGEDEKQ
jgi:hypothetical protein